MAAKPRASQQEIRAFYARLMAAASKSNDPRLERAFELVPREAFLPPGPWQIVVDGRYVATPSADPIFLYQNVLVAIDAVRGINNGEPFLHAAWIGAAAPQAGEVVCHIGAGTGYYTALLSVLVLPDGHVHGFEIEPDLAERARENLAPFENASIVAGDATKLDLPPSDLIYVNAGVVAPPRSWLEALRLSGRMIFPWRPLKEVGLTLMVRRSGSGFSVKPLMRSWFIPCIGASSGEGASKVPTRSEAQSVRSVWLTADRKPDDTAAAIYEHVWFSTEAVPDIN